MVRLVLQGARNSATLRKAWGLGASGIGASSSQVHDMLDLSFSGEWPSE